MAREKLDFGADLFDKVCFFIFKILPRLGIIYLATWIYKDSEKSDQILFFIAILIFIFVYFLPPFYTVITITKNADDIDHDFILFKLYKAGQGHCGVYKTDDCFLIKSYYGNATACAKMLMDKYNLR